MRGFLEPWKRITVAAEELIAVGEKWSSPSSSTASGGSGVPIDFRYLHVWFFTEGRAMRLEAVRERDDAVAAASHR